MSVRPYRFEPVRSETYIVLGSGTQAVGSGKKDRAHAARDQVIFS